MRALVLALVPAIAGCTCDAPSKPAAGSGSARAVGSAAGSGEAEAPARGAAVGSAGSAGSAGAPARSACTAETAIRVSRVLTDPAHPCHARIQAAYGRLVRVGGGASGTIVSAAAARGTGLIATCRPCAGLPAAEGDGTAQLEGGAWLADPTREPPLAFRVGAPARLAGGAVPGGPARLPALGLFGTDDVTLAALGQPAALDDPRGLAAARAPFVDVRPGTAALVLGFADAEGGELVASVGPVLDDDAARRGGYDPRVQLAIAARAVPGMLGGGVFDEGGRFVGVVVRAAEGPAGGAPAGVPAGVPLVGAVRATAIAARLSAALRAAPVPLRAKILPYLP